jgi:5-(carboxyamino)imidazole ribonucleotide mutase
MEKCTRRLEDLRIDYELEVRSAHRNPEDVAEYVASAPERGIKVFICAAGMAAHLAGAVAALSLIPNWLRS